jgi:hypothetical protein
MNYLNIIAVISLFTLLTSCALNSYSDQDQTISPRYPDVKWNMKRDEIINKMSRTHILLKNDPEILVFKPQDNQRNKYSKYTAFTLHNNQLHADHSSLIEAE